MSEQILLQEQVEIIDLLRSELVELDGHGREHLNTNIYDEQKDTLHVLSIQLEHVANALNLAGLRGLSFCMMRLKQIFAHLFDERKVAPSGLSSPLCSWGPYFLTYLDTLGVASAKEQESHVDSLLKFLSQDSLPCKFTPDDISHARALFHISELSTSSEETLPQKVTGEMTSLAIGPDVNPELLEGLLLELPDQTKQFESSINQFLDSKIFDDLGQAQRVAHTIKGAANVVSIRGMAYLTHFTEDLLETAAKNLKHPTEDFCDLLIRVSDCLASTAEYLNREGPRPDDLLETTNAVLGWLHRLKDQQNPGVAAEPQENQAKDTKLTTQPGSRSNDDHDSGPTPEELQHTEASAPEQKEENTGEEQRHINLPEKTSQELLRLSGEMQISNNQVSSQISKVGSSIELTHSYHQQIKSMAEELEALIQTQSALKAASMKYEQSEIDPLEMERFSELHTFSNRLQELATDSFESIASIEQQVKELLSLTHGQKQLNKENQNILLEMNLLPVGNLSSRFSRCVRQTCRLTGKLATLNITGEHLLVDSRVLNRIADPLMHLLRNAIDHGIEEKQDRLEAGKLEMGTLSLSFTSRGDTIEIQFKDDGRGLDYKRIKTIATEKGLLLHENPSNINLLNQIIFMPGFSTRSNATQISGRGIGLDSVQAEIRALKGNINIESEPGNGCLVSITVPTSILTAHSLLVECRDRHMARTYGIATRGIKQLVYTTPDQFIQKGRNTYVKLNDRKILLQPLNELLDIYSLEDEIIHAVLITERRNGMLVAIGVEKIISSQDLVIKSLNKYSYQTPGVIGATILGDGSVSPVIDLNDLPSMSMSAADRHMLQEKRARQILKEKASFTSPPAALVVDDSLSTRRSLAQFVSDLGMEVYTAKDGYDAIHVMKDKKPSLMLVDLEMPRMNGLELTAHMRSRKEYQDIPVIMITSRSTQRHKNMAQNAGVTRYLTKPWSEDELLNCIKKEIA